MLKSLCAERVPYTIEDIVDSVDRLTSWNHDTGRSGEKGEAKTEISPGRTCVANIHDATTQTPHILRSYKSHVVINRSTLFACYGRFSLLLKHVNVFVWDRRSTVNRTVVVAK